MWLRREAKLLKGNQNRKQKSVGGESAFFQQTELDGRQEVLAPIGPVGKVLAVIFILAFALALALSVTVTDIWSD